MKTPTLGRLVGLFVVTIIVSGCATTATETRENLLINSGFHSVTASTAQQKKLLAQLPSDQISKVRRNNAIWFVFPNQAASTALVGTQAQYTAYLQRASAQHVQPVPLNNLQTPVFTGWAGTTWGTDAQATRIPRRQ